MLRLWCLAVGMDDNMKRLATLMALALSAALTLVSLPAIALADPPETQRTVTWLSTEPQPDFASSLTVDGITYQLSATAVATIDSQYGQVPAQRSQTVSCWPADLDATRAAFPASMTVDENGYQGAIPLVSVTQNPVQVVRDWEVNETRSFSDLTSNDAAQIPVTVAAVGAETGNALTLRLASLSWTVDATAPNGLPTSYTATAIYRGADQGMVLDHYDVTAFYEGTVQAAEPVTTYQATLSYIGPDPDAKGLAAEPSQDLNAGLLAAAAAAVAAAAGGIFFWYRSRDVRVCRRQGSSLKVVAKVASKRQRDGSLRVELPASLYVVPGEMALILAPHKANGAPMVISHCGMPIANVTATERVLF